jgi:hypothetical protein
MKPKACSIKRSIKLMSLVRLRKEIDTRYKLVISEMKEMTSLQFHGH